MFLHVHVTMMPILVHVAYEYNYSSSMRTSYVLNLEFKQIVQAIKVRVTRGDIIQLLTSMR